jgi:Lar family restriction alleviation protein
VTPELKPCPFCGGTLDADAAGLEPDDAATVSHVYCSCGAAGPGSSGDYSETIEAWNRRHTPPLAHLSDEAWKDITIERCFQRVKSAERIVMDAAEAADLDGAWVDLPVVIRAIVARAEAAERRVAELEAEVAHAYESRQEYAEAIAPQLRREAEPTPKAPTVHGIPLAVGQRWVFVDCRAGGAESPPPSDDIITDLHEWSGRSIVSLPAEPNGRHTDWTVEDFASCHPRLRLPEELTPVEPSQYAKAAAVHAMAERKSVDPAMFVTGPNSYDAASEPAKVEAEPGMWGRDGMWCIDDHAGGRALRLIRRDEGEPTLWDAHDVAGVQRGAALRLRRPATTEESAKLEAEYQRNVGPKPFDPDSVPHPDGFGGTDEESHLVSTNGVAKRLPVKCSECPDFKHESECRQPGWGSCDGFGVERYLPGRVDVMRNEAPPSWCPKRAGGER